MEGLSVVKVLMKLPQQLASVSELLSFFFFPMLPPLPALTSIDDFGGSSKLECKSPVTSSSQIHICIGVKPAPCISFSFSMVL